VPGAMGPTKEEQPEHNQRLGNLSPIAF